MADEKLVFKIATDDDGDYHIYHTKNDKEICITKEVFKKLLKLIPVVDEYLENGKENKWHLYEDWYLHISYFTLPKKKKNKYMFKEASHESEPEVEDIKCIIHIRRWFHMEGHHLPMRDGLAFTKIYWKYLLETVEAYQRNDKKTNSEVDDEEHRGPNDEDLQPNKRKQINPKKRSGETLEYLSKRKNSLAKKFTD